MKKKMELWGSGLGAKSDGAWGIVKPLLALPAVDQPAAPIAPRHGCKGNRNDTSKRITGIGPRCYLL